LSRAAEPEPGILPGAGAGAQIKNVEPELSSNLIPVSSEISDLLLFFNCFVSQK